MAASPNVRAVEEILRVVVGDEQYKVWVWADAAVKARWEMHARGRAAACRGSGCRVAVEWYNAGRGRVERVEADVEVDGGFAAALAAEGFRVEEAAARAAAGALYIFRELTSKPAAETLMYLPVEPGNMMAAEALKLPGDHPYYRSTRPGFARAVVARVAAERAGGVLRVRVEPPPWRYPVVLAPTGDYSVYSVAVWLADAGAAAVAPCRRVRRLLQLARRAARLAGDPLAARLAVLVEEARAQPPAETVEGLMLVASGAAARPSRDRVREVLSWICDRLGSPEPEKCAAPLAEAVMNEIAGWRAEGRGFYWLRLGGDGVTVDWRQVPPGCRREARELAGLLSRPGGDAVAKTTPDTFEEQLYGGDVYVARPGTDTVVIAIETLGMEVAVNAAAGLASSVYIHNNRRAGVDTAAWKPEFYAVLAGLVADALRAAAGARA